MLFLFLEQKPIHLDKKNQCKDQALLQFDKILQKQSFHYNFDMVDM